MKPKVKNNTIPKGIEITKQSCRVCLKKCKPQDKNFNKKQSQQYLECTGFSIKVEDIPKKICKKCDTLLTKFIKFRTVAADTEKCLQNITSEINSEKAQQKILKFDFAEIKEEYLSDGNDNDAFEDEFEKTSGKGDSDLEQKEEENIENPDKKPQADKFEVEPVKEEQKMQLAIDPADVFKQEVGAIESESEVEPNLPIEPIKKSTKKRYNRKCKHCPRMFSNSRQLEKHINECHTNTFQLYYCDICDNKRPYKLKTYLIEHMRQRHFNRKPKEKFTCPICFKVLCGKFNLQGHIERIHTKTSQFVCQFCAGAFNTKEKLQRHVVKEHFDQSGSEKLYCHFCNKSYIERSPLVAHIRFAHLNVRLQKHCPHCDYQTYSVNMLKEHIGRAHMREQDWEFSCPFCEKKFIMKCKMDDHIKGVHQKIRDVPCPKCGMCFRNNKQMEVHFTAIHNPGKFTCKHCNKVFTTDRYLAQHMKTHTQEGYECPLCPYKKFSFVTTLRGHITTNHPEIQLPPPRTPLKNFDWSQLGFF